MLLKEEVDAQEIAQIVSRWTHIPVSKLMEGETQKLLHMEDWLRQRVVGQENALQEALQRPAPGRAPVRSTANRPLGSFIFLGPTGVGKTAWPQIGPSHVP